MESGLGIGYAKLHSLSGQQGVVWGVHKSWDNLGPAANAAFLVREELQVPLPPLAADGQPFLFNSTSAFIAALRAEDEFKENGGDSHKKSQELKGREEGADVLADGAHGECSDSCKSCQHWNSPEVLAAVYSLQFGSDEALTAAQTSALADAAVAVSYCCLSCWSCNSCKN